MYPMKTLIPLMSPLRRYYEYGRSYVGRPVWLQLELYSFSISGFHSKQYSNKLILVFEATLSPSEARLRKCDSREVKVGRSQRQSEIALAMNH
ncbi:hypothetical protein TNCV_79701 [Trichonephila clavipes]|nr:hypothetical protein TNCV_79701 [Trichonephila clavipes]